MDSRFRGNDNAVKKLFIATRNKGKLKEINLCLSGLDLEILSMLDRTDIPDIAETGKTFEENAWKKAREVYDIVKMPVLADDSGLEVEYLHGAPGVYSSRYAGENATDNDNCAKLLKELKGLDYKNRKASFSCVLTYYDGSFKNIFKGLSRGHIINDKRGKNGFGYDPLFVPEGYSKTFAELEDEVKNKISHRGKALQKLKEYLLRAVPS